MAEKAMHGDREERRRMMLEDRILKILPIVAIPMIISMLIDSIYNVADTYFVSQLGKSATAAVGINDSLMHFIRAMSMGFGVGASSYISRLMGAKEEEEACRVATTTLFTSVGILSFGALLASLFVQPLVVFLGATESAKPFAMQYARFILISAPFTAGEVCLSQLLRSEGSTKLSMIGMVSGCVLNVALDPIFIHVLGLGVAGAAIATTISKIVSFSVLLSPFLRHKTMLEIRRKYFTPKASIYKEVAKMGIPVFLRASLMSVSQVVTNKFAASFGDSALAANSVGSKCTRVVASAIMGFGQGFQPIAGYCWGAKKYRRVREAFWTTTGVGMSIGVILAIVMAVFSVPLVKLFAAEDPEVIELGSLIIRTQCYTMIFHVWVMIINSLFQAIGRAIPAGILGMARQILCLIPAVIVLSLVFGVKGLCVAQAVADLMTMCIAVPMVVHIMKELKQRAAEQEAQLAAQAN